MPRCNTHTLVEASKSAACLGCELTPHEVIFFRAFPSVHHMRFTRSHQAVSQVQHCIPRWTHSAREEEKQSKTEEWLCNPGVPPPAYEHRGDLLKEAGLWRSLRSATFSGDQTNVAHEATDFSPWSWNHIRHIKSVQHLWSFHSLTLFALINKMQKPSWTHYSTGNWRKIKLLHSFI